MKLNSSVKKGDYVKCYSTKKAVLLASDLLCLCVALFCQIHS